MFCFYYLSFEGGIFFTLTIYTIPLKNDWKIMTEIIVFARQI